MSPAQPVSSAVVDAHAPPIRVREASTRDLDAVVSLRLALLREHPDHPIYGRLRTDITPRARELYTAQLRSTHEAIFLAERESQVLGILRCVESAGSPLLEPERYAYVSSVYVRQEARRTGEQRARGLEQMRLHNVAGSVEAEGAWGALGFEVVEQVRVRSVTPERR
jgi:ribosomal protein S18 acetylase RimI-like enzyme